MPFDPFDSSTTVPNSSSPNDSCQRVTIPYIPELFAQDYLDQILGPSLPRTPGPEGKKIIPNEPTNAFITAFKEEGNKSRNCNDAPAFASTFNPVLDAFSTIDGNTPGKHIHRLLRESWAESPEKTLRIIWNLRSIHDGKASKMNFYRAFGWLYSNHPKTAIGNLQLLVDQVIEQKPKPKKKDEDKEDYALEEEDFECTSVDSDALGKEAFQPSSLSHGYYKDLLNILLLAYYNQLSSSTEDFTALESPRPDFTQENGAKATRRRKNRQTAKAEKRKENGGKKVCAKEVAEYVKKTQLKASRAAKKARSDQAFDDHTKLINKLKTNPAFKALYIAVSRIFASSLESDIKILREIVKAESKKEKRRLKWKLTMAAKWAPTLQCSHDRHTNIATGIALVMYSNGALEGLNKQLRIDDKITEVDAKLLRGFWRRWILSPLRRYKEVIEAKMSAGEWDSVIYTQVPSLSFARNKEHFAKHDETRLSSYLEDVMSGEMTISGATLPPHKLVYEAIATARTLDMYSKSDLERLREQERINRERKKEELLQRLRSMGSGLRYARVVEGKISSGTSSFTCKCRLSHLPETRSNSSSTTKRDGYWIPHSSFTCKCRLSHLPETRSNSSSTTKRDGYFHLQAAMLGKRSISGTTFLPRDFFFKPFWLSQTNKPIRLSPTTTDSIRVRTATTNMQIISAQWKTLVEKMREGTLTNCLAICDVSGSMGNINEANRQRHGPTQTDRVPPIFSSIGLSLLLAQLASPPVSNSFITFSKSPEIATLSTEASFVELVRTMASSNWGGNADFEAVFTNLILPMTIRHKIPKDGMINKLFVFSDMQFNRTPGGMDNKWETSHQQITRAFEEVGYKVPEIVYWSLQGGVGAKQVTKDTPRVAMMSGFSGNMLKLFMEGADEVEVAKTQNTETKKESEDEKENVDGLSKVQEKKQAQNRVSPEEIMNKALNQKSFEGLKVLD